MINILKIFDKSYFEENTKDFRIKNLIILIFFLTLYITNKLFLSKNNTFFSFYFNDLLVVVVLFSAMNVICSHKVKRITLLFIFTCIASFFWEYVALFIKYNSVFDFLDILCYFISMTIYIIFLYLIKEDLNF